MVTGAYYLVVTYGDHLPLVRGGHEAWRYTLMSGIVPAIPLILIRPFLPESPAWREKKAAGTLKRPSFGELFRPEFRRTTIVTTIMMACAYGAAFGAIQQMPRIVPGLAEVRTLPRPAQEQTVSAVQSFQEFGGLAGRFAARVPRGPDRQPAPAAAPLPGPGLILLPLVFLFAATSSLSIAEVGHLSPRADDDRAVQFLGELSAARLSDLPARHRRELRGERRRADDRHVGGAADDAAGAR